MSSFYGAKPLPERRRDLSPAKKHTKTFRYSKDEVVINTQVINEVSNNMLKKLGFDNSEVKDFIESCYQRFTVQEITRKTMIIACDIREAYNISYHDSLILSAAIEAGCNNVISEDMQHRLCIFKSLHIVNPFLKN